MSKITLAAFTPLHCPRFTASWEDDTGRYHVWIENSGTIGEIIYKNPHAKSTRDPGYFPTRQLDLNAKAHAETKAAIEAFTAEDFKKAERALIAEYEAKAAAQEKQQRQDGLKQLEELAEWLGYTLTKKETA